METSNPKILLVDDNKENLQLFTNVLRPYNYDLSIATNGHDAINSLKHFHPDLILLDVMMPDLNGFETLKKIKAEKVTQDIPVIFLTAKNSTEDIIEGFEAGAVDYMVKPFHPKEMVARINTHLAKANLLSNLKTVMEHTFHELYTPLSVISSAMQMQELEYEKNSYTQMTLAACRTLQNLYDDMYYSIDYAHQDKEVSTFDLAQFIQERVNYFQLIAESRGLTLTTTLPEKFTIHINKKEIERVLDNLISNALKYSQENEKVSIILEQIESSWELSVCNSVDQNIDVEMIFQKYYRENEKVFGMGIGLALVQSLCKKNKIYIGAEYRDELFCISMLLKEAI
ncbi:ATP-binding response regulator [Sulfurimonas microaerophilic]|uniref:ATP-binding response regulator n=1 Tax=Sulfurimonas microaerophilic TaxID=3058392 RepID=UPI00271538D7|nr:response regulator [Sulfurimonas sp. hsl 1-7]